MSHITAFNSHFVTHACLRGRRTGSGGTSRWLRWHVSRVDHWVIWLKLDYLLTTARKLEYCVKPTSLLPVLFIAAALVIATHGFSSQFGSNTITTMFSRENRYTIRVDNYVVAVIRSTSKITHRSLGTASQQSVRCLTLLLSTPILWHMLVLGADERDQVVRLADSVGTCPVLTTGLSDWNSIIYWPLLESWNIV